MSDRHIFLGIAVGCLGGSISLFVLWLYLADKFFSSWNILDYASLVFTNISFWLFFLTALIYLILSLKEPKE